jgi:hypothetical protein
MSDTHKSPSSPLTSVSLVRAPFQRADKKVKKPMRSVVPDTLRTAAIQLLERVRVGLDIPSRAEVMDLADRISRIADKLEALETKRSADSELVAELRAAKTQTPKLARANPGNTKTTGTSSLAAAAASLQAKPRARAVGPAKPKAKSPAKAKAKAKAKPRGTKAAAKAKAKTSKAKAPGRTAKKTAASNKPKTSKRPNSKASRNKG